MIKKKKVYIWINVTCIVKVVLVKVNTYTDLKFLT